jgi:hypothetical protein
MASDDPFLFCPLGCLSFFFWPLMTTFSFVHWVFCPLYFLCWPLSLLSFSFWNKLIIIKCKFSFVVSFEHKLKTVKQNDMIYFASFNILPRQKCT